MWYVGIISGCVLGLAYVVEEIVWNLRGQGPCPGRGSDSDATSLLASSAQTTLILIRLPESQVLKDKVGISDGTPDSWTHLRVHRSLLFLCRHSSNLHVQGSGQDRGTP